MLYWVQIPTMILALPIILIVFTTVGYLVGKILASELFSIQKKIEKVANIRRFHLHHDLCGLLLMATSFLTMVPTLSIKVAFFGLGLGLLTHHLTTEGLKLITKT